MWLIVDLERGKLDGWYCSQPLAAGVAAMYRAEGLCVIVVRKDDAECWDMEAMIGDGALIAELVPLPG